jgi:glycopeptide antibiotics resistance protein
VASNCFELIFGPPIFPTQIDPLSPRPLLLLVIPLYVLRRRGRSAGYLLSLTLFVFYLWVVFSYTILDSLPPTREHLEIIQRASWLESVNFIPSAFVGSFNVYSRQVYGNFLLGVPFGFAVPFVAQLTCRKVVLLGSGFAASIEVAQLLVGVCVLGGPYRVIDVDDVWIVFVGILFGHGALWLVARAYRRIVPHMPIRVPIWSHFHSVLLHVSGHAGCSNPQKEQTQAAVERENGA